MPYIAGGRPEGQIMKRFMKSGLVILFLLLVLFGSITIHTILQSQDNGRLINYVGIVRGATQRLVKLELRNQEEDSIIDYLDGILLELTTGKGSYGLPLPEDDTYQKNLYRLNDMWDEIKNEIFNFRSGGTDGKALLSLSENYFGQANETVFAAEKYASNRIHKLLVVCAVTLGIMLITWVYIFGASLKKLFRLEKRNKKLTDLANRDPLTGVYQLNVFKDKAQNVLDTKQNVKIAVLYTDFTDFKYINDVFGYAAGDRVLKRYGELLMDGLQEGELCGRVLADHFVLLYNYQNKEEISCLLYTSDAADE